MQVTFCSFWSNLFSLVKLIVVLYFMLEIYRCLTLVTTLTYSSFQNISVNVTTNSPFQCYTHLENHVNFTNLCYFLFSVWMIMILSTNQCFNFCFQGRETKKAWCKWFVALVDVEMPLNAVQAQAQAQALNKYDTVTSVAFNKIWS